MAEVPSILYVPIGDVVRKWREFRGLKLTELAQRAGLSKGYVSEVERNVIGEPKPPQLAKLAGALGIEVWDLISRRMPHDMEGFEENALSAQHRQIGALASPPITRRETEDELSTLGRTIDTILMAEDLSPAEHTAMAEILIPHVMQLIRTIKDRMRGSPR